MSHDANELAFSNADASLFVPDGTPATAALVRTTHLGVGAHPDDLEILAIEGILECFGKQDQWFTGVVVGDGASSPRSGAYQGFDDARMREVRRREQNKAAHIGAYSAVIQLSHSSAHVKDATYTAVVDDLERVLRTMQPDIVYTHDLADRHDTHVAVVLRLVAAVHRLPMQARPRRLIGCEVWRDLDWLPAANQVVMPLGSAEHLETALLGVFDSQIAGGKRYDLGALGRRRAHAVFGEPRKVDRASGIVLGMDLTPLLMGSDALGLAESLIQSFQEEVRARLRRLA